MGSDQGAIAGLLGDEVFGVSEDGLLESSLNQSRGFRISGSGPMPNRAPALSKASCHLHQTYRVFRLVL
jgi:hypothetical protein